MIPEQRQFQNKIIATSIVFSLITGFIAGGLSSDLFSRIDWSAVPGLSGIIKTVPLASQMAPFQTALTGDEEPIVRTVKIASPAVVSVIISRQIPAADGFNPFEGTPFEDFFRQFSPSQETERRQIGGGSGFIVASDGLILTNKHVVADNRADYSVLTSDGQEYPARVLARDPFQDIALIKIDKNNLSVLRLGDSDKIEVGQTVIAIGNALAEFSNTVSVGIVSGLGRSISAGTGFGSPAEQLQDVIQTDAAINPGNSGGPLLNLSGEVIGMNVAIAQGAQNVGFALPINAAKRDIEQVKNGGGISYPYLGVRYVLITPDIGQQNNLSVDYGALIIGGQGENEPAIVPGSPADKAGLKEGDIILEADGQRINIDNSLAGIIQSHSIGDAITLKILSGGQEETVRVVLEEMKP